MVHLFTDPAVTKLTNVTSLNLCANMVVTPVAVAVLTNLTELNYLERGHLEDFARIALRKLKFVIEHEGEVGSNVPWFGQYKTDLAPSKWRRR